jgi:glutamate-ammonia-ligase adenylyltransferase
LQAKFGQPQLNPGVPCRYVILALGKLGGREMSYHSDLDLLVIYEGEGRTAPPANSRTAPIENHGYFTEFAQKLIKAMSQMGPLGKLYSVDMKLRPTGKSGSLVIPLESFTRYYASGGGMIWERQSLTRARSVYGDPLFAKAVQSKLTEAIRGMAWCKESTEEIHAMRCKLEASTSSRSLKRAPGGMMDVEFLVQLLQLKYAATLERFYPNTWEAIEAFRDLEKLSPEEAAALSESYSFLRRAEARLRIVTNRPLTEYPESPEDQNKLARRMGFEKREPLLGELQKQMQRVRAIYSRVMLRESQGS